MKKAILFAWFALLSMTATSWAAGPDGYPKAPISLVVCYSPGAATDFQARIVSMTASDDKYFGQPMVIVNRAGAGGMTGWNWVAEKGGRDGLTMTAYNLPHMVAQALVQKPKFTTESFEPLCNWGTDPQVLVVITDSPYKSVDELVAFAKANPGKVTVNGGGLYIGQHIVTLQLEKAAGVKLTYIPEQGTADVLNSLYGKAVIAGMTNLSDAYRAKDRLRILAIADLQRHEFLPDVPTFKELGYDIDNSSVNFRGFAFPAGVPKEIVEYAAKQVEAMFKDPMVASKMKEAGSPMNVLPREEVQKMIAQQKAVLTKLLITDKK